MKSINLTENDTIKWSLFYGQNRSFYGLNDLKMVILDHNIHKIGSKKGVTGRNSGGGAVKWLMHKAS